MRAMVRVMDAVVRTMGWGAARWLWKFFFLFSGFFFFVFSVDIQGGGHSCLLFFTRGMG